MTSALDIHTPGKLEQIKAVCLDIDDTLVDSVRSMRLGLKALVGNDAAWPVWRRTSDQHYARFVAGEIDFEMMCRERTRAFFAAFGEELGDDEVAAREQRRMAAMQRSWSLFADAEPCLRWLRASGLRLAVISNTPGGYQRKKIASVGLADAFDELIISEEVGSAKPDPAIFHTACAALGLRPSEVVHVGDRLDLDAEGAIRAGLHGVWLNRNGADLPVPPGVSMITSLDELAALLACELPMPTRSARRGWLPEQRAVQSLVGARQS